MQRIQHILNLQPAVQFNESACVFLEHDDLLRAQLAEVFHILPKLVYFQIIFLLLFLQKLCEFLLLFLRVCVLEGNSGNTIVMNGI